MIGKIKIPCTGKQQGVGLIDVMIAVVIFSFGMLGLAALQTINKQSNYEAIQRSTAAMLAQDIQERMRMNSLKDATSTYKSSLGNYVPSSPVTLSYSDTLTEPSPNCSAALCTYAELAAWDLYEFQQMLRGTNEKAGGTTSVGGLVSPTVCISTAAVSGSSGVYTITIVWRGQTSLPLSAVPTNTCGAGIYDKTAGDYAYRRILEMNSFMSCPDPGGCV